MRLSSKQKELLEKYSISYEDKEYKKSEDINKLLMEIDWEMTEHVDEDDEPLEDFLILEKLYDEIYYATTDEDGYAIEE